MPPPSTVGQGYPGVRIGALRIWFARPVKLWGAPCPGSARIPQPIGSSCVTLIPLADRYFSLPAQSTIMLKVSPIAKEALYYPKKSLFCSSSAFTIHAGTTRQSGCPPTLAAHFPGSITAVEQLREPLACFLPILYTAPGFSICRHHEEEVFVQSDPDSKSLPPYSKAITIAHGTHKLTRRRRRPPNRRPRHTKARLQTGGGIALVLQPRLS